MNHTHIKLVLINSKTEKIVLRWVIASYTHKGACVSFVTSPPSFAAEETYIKQGFRDPKCNVSYI